MLVEISLHSTDTAYHLPFTPLEEMLNTMYCKFQASLCRTRYFWSLCYTSPLKFLEKHRVSSRTFLPGLQSLLCTNWLLSTKFDKWVLHMSVIHSSTHRKFLTRDGITHLDLSRTWLSWGTFHGECCIMVFIHWFNLMQNYKVPLIPHFRPQIPEQGLWYSRHWRTLLPAASVRKTHNKLQGVLFHDHA